MEEKAHTEVLKDKQLQTIQALKIKVRQLEDFSAQQK